MHSRSSGRSERVLCQVLGTGVAPLNSRSLVVDVRGLSPRALADAGALRILQGEGSQDSDIDLKGLFTNEMERGGG